MDVTTIPADTCPLCQQRALRWEGGTCVCGSCGSRFVTDPQTRRCQYTYIAPEYATLVTALTQDWLTRREVFERARQVATPPAESVIEQGVPETGSVNPTPDAELQQSNLAQESPAPHVPLGGGKGIPRPAAPITAVWAVLIGALALIPILCACLSALLLGKDVSRTREMIVAANRPTVAVSSTLVGLITSTVGITDMINPLESPLMTPTPEVTSLVEATAGTIEAGSIPTPVNPTAETPQNPMPTPPPPTLMFQSPLPTPQPQSQPGEPTATLPPTFTALPASLLTTTATPEPTATSGTPTPTGTAAVSGTVTPTPTPTSNATYTGSIRITMVMYTGTASLNMSDQYVEVANVSSAQASISNWTITAASNGKSFMFYNGLVLQAGQTCRIYGNSPPQTTGGCGALSFNSSTPVWSTTKDTTRLYDQNGALMSSYSYP